MGRRVVIGKRQGRGEKLSSNSVGSSGDSVPSIDITDWDLSFEEYKEKLNEYKTKKEVTEKDSNSRKTVKGNHIQSSLDTDFPSFIDKKEYFEEVLEEHKSLDSLYPAIHRESSLKYREIAGQGDEREYCGVHIPSEFCCGCGNPKLSSSDCDRRLCPVCWEMWRDRAVRRSVLRLLGYDFYNWRHESSEERVIRDYEDLSELRFIHGTISPDRDIVKNLSDKELRDYCKELAKEWGFEGFGLIRHDFRVKETIKKELHEEFDIEEEGGFWKAIIDDKLELGDFRHYVKQGIHFHVVGFTGRRWSGSEKLKSGDRVGTDDVVLERIGDLGGVEDVQRCLMYISTHATPKQGRAWITYNGDVANNKFSTSGSEKIKSINGREKLYLEGLLEDLRDFEHDDSCRCEECGGTSFMLMMEAEMFLRLEDDIRFRGRLERANELYQGFESAINTFKGVDDPPDPRSEEEVLQYIEGGC